MAPKRLTTNKKNNNKQCKSQQQSALAPQDVGARQIFAHSRQCLTVILLEEEDFFLDTPMAHLYNFDPISSGRNI
ncbi:unnamed protein product [Ceratitis capitata]|uniref:(Mediterranean fruit fly) hypothetical protein n=1 Tax=Ceratitis capitata TaxID=7213 RepID=A0A811V4G3_CERCA|nr:unnamed protein product [Ceratitis capitata]